VFDRYTLADTFDPSRLETAFTEALAPKNLEPLETVEAARTNASAPGIPLEGTPQAQAGTYPLYLTVADFP
jgi:hypothetical protein